MGLPAFDMLAFEAAQSAVATKPRATTTIFLGAKLSPDAPIDETREYVRASTDALIESYASWRAGALRGVAELPMLIESACRSQSLSLLRSLSDHLADLLATVECDRKAYTDLDDEAIRGAASLASHISRISSDSGRFVRREIRRVEQMAKARAAVYDKILLRTSEAKKRLDSFISSQSFQNISLLEENEKVERLQNALRRPADVEGVRERTARRLKQFPKTAAYLAR